MLKNRFDRYVSCTHANDRVKSPHANDRAFRHYWIDKNHVVRPYSTLSSEAMEITNILDIDLLRLLRIVRRMTNNNSQDER